MKILYNNFNDKYHDVNEVNYAVVVKKYYETISTFTKEDNI